MIRNILIGAACFFSAGGLACGAVDDDSIEPTDDSGELGELEQEISIGNGGYGFSTAASRPACAQPGGTGQICVIPGPVSKNVKYCIAGGGSFPISGTNATRLREGVQLVDADLSAWTFTEVAITDTTCHLQFVGGPVSGTGPNISDIMGVQTFGEVALTSPAGASHVNGTWFSFTDIKVTVDTPQIGSGGDVSYRLVGGNGAAKFTGLGTQAGAAYTSSPTRKVVGIALTGHLTAGEKCRANNHNPTSPTTISAVVGCGV